jgi:hypothetical protein
MHVVRDLLDQALRDVEGKPAGRVDDLSLSIESDGVFVDAILSGGGILADDLGLLGRACEGIARAVRRRPLRRTAIPWSSISEIAEHALTVVPSPGAVTTASEMTTRPAMSLRVLRHLALRTTDGMRLHLVDLQVADGNPAARMQVSAFIVRPRRRFSWPTSLRPRPRAPGTDWRFIPASSVQVTPTELVVERAYDALMPMTEAEVTRPPKRIPRADT